MLKIHKAGLWTSVQDLGRLGYRHFGVPVAGVMDARSAKLANLLLNNPPDAAALEITMTGPELEFTQPARIAITGADMSPQLNGQVCAMNKAIEIKPGDRLSFGHLQYGLRSYLAVAEGFQTALVMESRSFYANVTEKGKLINGDELHYGKWGEKCEKWGQSQFSAPDLESNKRSQGKIDSDPIFSSDGHSHAAVKVNMEHFSNGILEAYPGPEFEYLSEKQKQQLLKSEFVISPRNNRMAYQLEGMIENSLKPILTSAVLPGTVQLTPSGQLIVLMRDCQTTGGYPRVLQLTEQAISQLAQKRQGDGVRFDGLCQML